MNLKSKNENYQMIYPEKNTVGGGKEDRKLVKSGVIYM